MKPMLKKTTISLCIITMLSGCATVPSPDPVKDPPIETNRESRMKRTLLVIGGILLVGAVIANEIEDNTKDAIKDAASPK